MNSSPQTTAPYAPVNKFVGQTGPSSSSPLREKYRQVLRQQGSAPEQVERYVDWCKAYVAYHHQRPPREMGAVDVGQFLQHVRQERGGAIEEARQALTILYRDVLGQAQALAPRLLERVRAVLRVRHYALRTEECYEQWIKRFILFHNKRHPVEMGTREVAEFLTHLAAEPVGSSRQQQAGGSKRSNSSRPLRPERNKPCLGVSKI